MPTDGRARFLLGSSAALIFWGALTWFVRAPVLVAGLPVVGVLWALLVLDFGYLRGRAWRHGRRRRSSAERRESRAPDPGVREPIDYPGVLPRADDDAAAESVDRQGRFRATGIRLAVLPATAVACLTVQAVILKGSGPLAVGFVLAECLLLVIMIWTVWSEREPSRPWVTSRVKAELFRREMFLLLGGVGPYLGQDADDAELTRDSRLRLLESDDSAQLRRLARLADQDAAGVETPWQDVVWARGPEGADSDTVERMRTYLHYRVRRQSLFFELAAQKCERTEGNLGRAVKGVVLAGIAVALTYAALLISGQDLDGRSPLVLGIALLAAVVPPLCNAVLAVQNLYAAQRLGVSYLEARNELLHHENALHRLISESGAPDGGTRFRSIVVQVETTLAEELRRWRIIVARPEFDTGL